MKNRKLFTIGFICLVVFIGIGTYFWYLYFRDYEGEVLSKNVRLELLNSGRVDYINATIRDTDEVIPIYYFRVKNNVNMPVDYEVLIKDVLPNEVKDGCDDTSYFKREELNYELKLNNKIIKSGLLSEISNNIIDKREMDGISSNDYSLRVWLNEKDENTLDKHYHYIVNIREIK